MYRNIEKIDISKCQNFDISKYRKIDISKYRLFDISKYRMFGISKYRTSVALHPRACPCFVCRYWWTKAWMCQISKSYRFYIFLLIVIVSKSIPISIVNTCTECWCCWCCWCCCVLLYIPLLLLLLLLAAAVRHRKPANPRLSFIQTAVTAVLCRNCLFYYARKCYINSTPLGSAFAFMRPRLLYFSWPLRACAEPQAGVSPPRRSPPCASCIFLLLMFLLRWLILVKCSDLCWCVPKQGS